jgi:hypothetical protein
MVFSRKAQLFELNATVALRLTLLDTLWTQKMHPLSRLDEPVSPRSLSCDAAAPDLSPLCDFVHIGWLSKSPEMKHASVWLA